MKMIKAALIIGGIVIMKAYLWIFLIPLSIFGIFGNKKLEDLLSN
jgi:hypothetical protein